MNRDNGDNNKIGASSNLPSNPSSADTYLTQYGYHISIDSIDTASLKKIINDLTVVPYRLDATKEDNEKSKFAVYRYAQPKINDDSARRSIIVPRYYGIANYGPPKKVFFNEEDIDIQFLKELRPKQLDVATKCIRYLQKHGGGLLSVPCGFGKCLAPGTEVIMYDGSVKVVEQIKVGDIIMGDDSTPRRILSTITGTEEMFRISDISTEESYRVNRSHILSLKFCGVAPITIQNEIYHKGSILDISVNDYMNILKNGTFAQKVALHNDFKGYRVKVDFAGKQTPFDPYEYGMSSTLSEGDITDYIINTIDVRERFMKGLLNRYIPSIDNNTSLKGKLINFFVDNNLTDSTTVYTKQFLFLARSLGYFCKNIRNVTTTGKVINQIILDTTHQFDGNIAMTYDIDIESLGSGTYYGFEIDGNRRFVLGDFTVTHNTVCALYIAQQLGLKTLVIVHKSFLLNQWIDRAREFLDTDRIGIIKQKKCTSQGKDLVIGMIQTIAKREYENVFDKFGLVIYDEAHHVACKFYSKALMKTGAKYTMALTATPYRGDRLIKVMYWFCGGTIYQEKIKMNKNVIVKMLHHTSTDKLYAIKKKWFKGQVRSDTGKMTTNFCNISSRNKSIIDIVNNLRRDQPERKILILSGRKSHLDILKEGIDKSIQKDIDDGIIDEDEIFSCYYTGDTKPVDRQDAEERGDIIFATYDMAHEGLDIKHLNTVILASPKKDVVQSIGRIMRTILKVGDVRPLIIDMADEIGTIGNWVKQRTTIYQKCKYEIEDYYLSDGQFITSEEYYGANNDFDNGEDNGEDNEEDKEEVEVEDKEEAKETLWLMNAVQEFYNDTDKFKRDMREFRDLCSNIEKKKQRDIKGLYYDDIYESNAYKTLHHDLSKNINKLTGLSTDLSDILYVAKLTDQDFDRQIVKEGGDIVDLNNDIALGQINDMDDDVVINDEKHIFNPKPKNMPLKRLF